MELVGTKLGTISIFIVSNRIDQGSHVSSLIISVTKLGSQGQFRVNISGLISTASLLRERLEVRAGEDGQHPTKNGNEVFKAALISAPVPFVIMTFAIIKLYSFTTQTAEKN